MLKYILLSVFLSVYSISFSQSFSQSLLVKVNIETVNCECSRDTTLKHLIFESNQSADHVQLASFMSNKCRNQFLISNPSRSIRMIIKATGYYTDTIVFQISNNIREVNIGRTVLLKNIKDQELKEVAILGNKKQFMKIEADKTTYLIKDNSFYAMGSIQDALRKLPGLRIDPSGGINLHGKIAAIYIDGVPSNLNGTNLTNYLQNLPASTIEKIELIAMPGASYEANTSGSVINIITQIDSFQNFSGTVSLNYGINNNFKSKYLPSILLNGKMKKVSWQLQTGYENRQSNSEDSFNMIYTDFNPYVNFHQITSSTLLSNSFYIRPMINIKINNTSNFIGNYNYKTSNDSVNLKNKSYSENFIPSLNYKNFGENRNIYNTHEFVGKYKSKLDTLGKLLQMTAYYSHDNKNSSNKSIVQNSDDLNRYGFSDIRLRTTNFYVKYDFDLPFRNFTLTTGGKYNIFTMRDLGRYDLNEISSSILIHPIFSSPLDFNFREYNLAFYAEAKKEFGQLSINAGLRFEKLRYKNYTVGNDTIFGNTMNNFFPTLYVLYRFSKTASINGSYSRKIAMPGYYRFDPNNNNFLLDNYFRTSGDTKLTPNFNNNFSLRLTAFNFYEFGIDYTYKKNAVYTIYKADSLITTRTYSNFSNIHYWYIYTSLPIPFKLFTEGLEIFKNPIDLSSASYLMCNIGYSRQIIPTYQYLDYSKPDINFYIASQIILPFKLKLYIGYFYQPSGYYGITKIEKPTQSLSVNLSRKFMANKLSTSLELSKPSIMDASNIGSNLITSFSSSSDKLNIWIKVSYNLGKYKGKEETEIRTEKKQVQNERY